MYKITFEDDSVFSGNSFEGDWNKMPDKAIKKIEYKVSDKSLILEGFEKYNHLVRVGFGVNANIKGVLAVYLLGKYEDKVYRRILSFKDHKIIKDVVQWGKEYCGRPHVNGWKKGVVSDQKPSIKFI